MDHPSTRPRRRLLPSIAIVLAVCALVYLPGLGDGGLTMSEGHRVVPAWEMLDTGEWLVPHLFGQPYLRKPPGMPWAVALSSALFGRTELAARLVSAVAATLMAVIALLWSRRWFGARGALASGLAQALMPQMWAWGRTAEIEALHALGAQILIFGTLETLRTRRSRWAGVMIAGLVLAAASKGPAAAPCLLGAILAACIVLGTRRTLGNLRLWIGLVGAGIAIGVGVAMIGHGLASLGQTPVTQGIDAFMWEPERVLLVLAFPAAAWVSALPASLALLFPWGPGARAEQAGGAPREPARLLAWTWVLSVAAYTLAGVSNPRYALPAAAVFAPLVGYAVSGLGSWMNARRARIARTMLLGAAPAWVPVLLIGAGASIFTLEARTRSTSGRAAGEQLGDRIADLVALGRIESANGVVVVAADHAIDARPEILAYAARRAHDRGVVLVPRWVPGGISVEGLEASAVVIRSDAGSPESTLSLPGWTPAGEWAVHEYGIVLLLPPGATVP